MDITILDNNSEGNSKLYNKIPPKLDALSYASNGKFLIRCKHINMTHNYLLCALVIKQSMSLWFENHEKRNGSIWGFLRAIKIITNSFDSMGSKLIHW